jgi:hypothetical protein
LSPPDIGVGAAVEDHVPDLPRAQVLRPGREAQEGVDLAISEQFERALGDPVYVAAGVEPDPAGHRGEEHLRARSQGLYSDGLTLQIGDAANGVARKQFEAADMHSRQHRHRLAVIDRSDELRGVIRTEIHLAAHERCHTIGVGGDFYVTHIGKAFGAQ